MVWSALAMENDCGTSAAAVKFVSPACEAVIVHGPAPVIWTVAPLTLQLPLAPKLTVRLELAVALTVKSASPKVLPASTPKLMVWACWPMENVCGTSVAALKLPLPPWEAVMVQEPAPVRWTVAPLTLHL